MTSFMLGVLAGAALVLGYKIQVELQKSVDPAAVAPEEFELIYDFLSELEDEDWGDDVT